MRRQGFTLVELLVVVVVIVTLMSITFRIANAGGDASARNYTVNRMQRLENCLSGYYAAFGSYPPVKLHGSRNFRYKVNAQGIQQVGSNGGSGSGGQYVGGNGLVWESVNAACKSQPVGMEFPFKNSNLQNYVRKVSQELIKRHNSSDPDYINYRNNNALAAGFDAIESPSTLSSKRNYEFWTDAQVFKFGLLSYLLPRYLIMMGGSGNNDDFFNMKQWTANNDLPCHFDDGTPFDNWSDVNDYVRNETWKVAAFPSQAVCARWLPNLEGILYGGAGIQVTVYGVSLVDSQHGGVVGITNWGLKPYSAAESQGSDSNSQQYVLDGLSCRDGWWSEFYYYSLPPYQNYRLWSAGPNQKTFPPWVSDEEFKSLDQQSKQDAQEWRSDDIVQMSY